MSHVIGRKVREHCRVVLIKSGCMTKGFWEFRFLLCTLYLNENSLYQVIGLVMQVLFFF